jgi:DNA repair protein RadA/Sms
MNKTKIIWECSACGHTQSKWSGNCSQCNSWNTFLEQIALEVKKGRFSVEMEERARPLRLKDISSESSPRIRTGIGEIDRLLGNGIVAGSLTLIGGEPGVGKSTLLLQLAEAFAKNGLKVLYICGEESVDQTSLRAKRLKIDHENVFLLHETLFSAIHMHIEALKPNVLIVDSVQIVYKGEIPSAPGSVVQVREIAIECMRLAKGFKMTTFLIGHVTKGGDLAGPRVLEHIVDTVLEFEGDRQQGFRILRCMKNRFGPTEDIALFQMKEKGLEEVLNPSMIFLEERMKNIPGSVVVTTVEGGRSILLEVQALVTSSVFPSPSRKCTGLDSNRLALLLAVLEKRLGYQLYKFDVFVSIAGGMKIGEPAIDLGVILAVASSYAGRSIDPDTMVLGEVGLGGEVRAIHRVESRIKEGILMGFTRCVLPKKNIKGISSTLAEKIQLVGIEVVDEAIDFLLV